MLERGTVLGGRWTITRTIVTGNTAVVYGATDAERKDECAVKHVRDDVPAASRDLVARKFADEVRFLATLDHPAIPHVRGFHAEEGNSWMAMDLATGSTLESALHAAGGPLPAVEVADAMVELLDVLEYLHGRTPPLLHRGIKPANLIREPISGHLKLVDFGIARVFDVADDTTKTMVGSLSWCPPEQIQGHPEPRSDLYAAGATMHHLLVGKAPAALNIKPLKAAAPNVDAGLAAIVDRATAQKPADRFASAAEMRAALIGWLTR